MDDSFAKRVYDLVAMIPLGRVMTYGDVARLCGQPRAARVVGGIAHYGPDSLPWHRLVNRFGGLASGYWGGREAQKAMLEQEGLTVNEQFIIEDFERLKWIPQS